MCSYCEDTWYALHFRVTSVVVQLLVVHHRHCKVSLGHFWYALHFSCEDIWYALHFDQDLLACTSGSLQWLYSY